MSEIDKMIEVKDTFIKWLEDNKAEDIEIYINDDSDDEWDYYVMVTAFINENIYTAIFMIWNGEPAINFDDDKTLERKFTISEFNKYIQEYVVDKLGTNFYEKYVGNYAKRFYTPFEKDNILKIVGFKIDRYALIEVEQYGETHFWDMDDSVIIIDEPMKHDIERVISVKHEQYNGFNPFN